VLLVASLVDDEGVGVIGAERGRAGGDAQGSAVDVEVKVT
jgi:hypothetical protein